MYFVLLSSIAEQGQQSDRRRYTMEYQSDNKQAGDPAAHAEVDSADTKTDTDVLQATQRVGALALGGEGKATASEATSAGTEATTPCPGVASSASPAAMSGGATGGGGGASTVDEQAAGAEPCAKTQHDDQAVLQMLYET